VFKDIQVTLYDIFGYFLPGVIVVFALTILFWAMCWPRAPYVIYTDFSGPVIAIFALTAYLCGHLSQACGNFLEKVPRAEAILEKRFLIDGELGSGLKKALAQRFGHGADKLLPREMYRLCDESLVHHGSIGERDIFTYREGFYRGVCVALALLAVALIVRLVRFPATLWILDSPTEIPFCALLVAVLLSIVGSWLCFRRYLRFAEHRIRTCLLRFLALSTSPPIAKKEEK